MNKKKIIALVGIPLLIVVIIALVITHMTKPEKSDKGFVFDKSSNIKLKDIETYYEVIDFKKQNTKDYFKDEIVNPYTLKFFMFLTDNFKEFDNEKDLLENINKYLYSIMPSDMADKIFAFYRKFLSYQLSLGEKTRQWGMPKTTEEAIDFLHKIQDYRREVFGRDVADILFGASVKAEEYPMRRTAILGDKNMYGAEKEKKLKQLNEDMWGEEADKVDAYAEPYVRYKEKLAMYEKDFSGMNEYEKQAQIRTIREEIFTKDQVKRLEDVDKAVADNEKKEGDYKASESEIMNDPSLDKAEKENKVQELQNQMFGEDADAFRRRLAIQRATEEKFKRK
ncbi:MAG: lipase secretion chaperone [Deltaproteobacteria bacterium]|nr:lipase secretion chaperone [Deltaproteobacteria bacterium]